MHTAGNCKKYAFRDSGSMVFHTMGGQILLQRCWRPLASGKRYVSRPPISNCSGGLRPSQFALQT
jgi:hypothetical protein